MTYALELGRRHAVIALDEAEQAYLARTTGREAYRNALEKSQVVGVQA